MPKRASPAVNRNLPNVPEADAILNALAREIMDQEALVAIREKRKVHRKEAELEGVNLHELDDLFKNRELNAEEVEALFRRKWAHFSAVYADLSDQLDLFAPKSVSRETKVAHGHAGRMAALMGKPAEAPDGLVGEPLQQWLEGWHTAREARVSASAKLADDLAAAIKIVEDGGVVDGKGDTVKAVEPKASKSKSNKAKADAVRLKAADDFEQDHNPLMVAGVLYATSEGAAEARAKIDALRGDVIGEPTAEEMAVA